MEKQIVIRDNAKWFNKELLEAKKRRKFEERWKRTKIENQERYIIKQEMIITP